MGSMICYTGSNRGRYSIARRSSAKRLLQQQRRERGRRSENEEKIKIIFYLFENSQIPADWFLKLWKNFKTYKFHHIEKLFAWRSQKWFLRLLRIDWFCFRTFGFLYSIFSCLIGWFSGNSLCLTFSPIENLIHLAYSISEGVKWNFKIYYHWRTSLKPVSPIDLFLWQIREEISRSEHN